MAVRRALLPIEPTGTVDIQELDDTYMNIIHSKYAEYVYSLYPATTLTVVGSGGNLPGLPMSDTRYQAGNSTSRVDRYATEAETPNISIITVNYSRISQSFASNTTPVDTNNLRYPLYLYDDGSDLHLRAMSSTDFYDTFVAPAISIINNSVNSVGDYYISTSLTPANGSILVSSTPVFTDTRANLAAYSSGSIPETPDQPSTINNYYLHVYGTNVTDGDDLPLYLDANDEQIKQYTLAQWAATLGPWLQYHYINLGDAPSYEINGIGTTQGSAMINTILSPTGTGYSTRFVNADDYRTQEFPNGTPVTANTYELKKFTPVNSFGALDESISYTLSSTGEVTIGASASVSISYTLEAIIDAPSDAGFAGSLPFTLDSGGEVLIEGTASVDASYSLVSEGEVLVEAVASVGTSYTLFASTNSDSEGDFAGSLPYTLSAGGEILIQGTAAVDTSYALSASTDAPSDGDFAGSLPFTLDSDGVVLIEGIGDVNTSYTLSASTSNDADAIFAGSLPFTLDSDGVVLIEGIGDVNTSYTLSASTDIPSDGDFAGSLPYTLSSEGDVLIEGTTSGTISYSLSAGGFPGIQIINPNAYGTASFDKFGYSVGIYGNTAVVGAYSEDDAGGSSSGKVYVIDVNTGSVLHTLDNPNNFGDTGFDEFGRSVAIHGNRIAVSAPEEDDSGFISGSGSGVVYIFDTANGSLIDTIVNPDTGTNVADDSFGGATKGLAMNSTYILAGKEFNDLGNTNQGIAYMFYTANSSLAYTLYNPNSYANTTSGDQFGSRVAMSEDYAAVQAIGEDAPDGSGGTYSSSGVVYIYDLNNNASLYRTIVNANVYGTEANDQFGNALSIDGDYIAIGASAEDASTQSGAGAAYVFQISTGNLIRTFQDPQNAPFGPGWGFGRSVVIKGNYIAIGKVDSLGTLSDKYVSVYLYDWTTGSLVRKYANLNLNRTTNTNEYSAFDMKAFGSKLIVSRHAESDNSLGGAVYIVDVPEFA